jgi:hypothetical protein
MKVKLKWAILIFGLALVSGYTIANLIIFFTPYSNDRFLSDNSFHLIKNLDTSTKIVPSFSLTYYSMKIDNELRKFDLTLIPECDEGDDDCVAGKIYSYLKHFNYSHVPKLYTPKENLQFGSTDCKNFALTYCHMLYQVGVDCIVVCNGYHCWNYVFTDDYKYLVDLTVPMFLLHEHNETFGWY